ncbi:MAG: PilZ domain-containing protein [Candidatus Omnitrophica bacterium]|nr:PilZ domain-containing protein [Candidatus Omnitrophota bacterium]
MPQEPQKKEPVGIERRQSIRINKNYILRFFLKDNPSIKFEISQIENISKGGMCFTSTVAFTAGDLVSIELRAPFIVDTLYLEGRILHISEKVKGLIYQNNLQFQNLTPLAVEMLEKIEKYNLNGDIK